MNNKFENPVIPGFHPDPTICRVGNDYWLATSSFEYFPGLPIFHSRDLVNWKLIGHALHRPEQLDLRGRPSSDGIFAPTLRHHNGTFYLITTDVGGLGNFILTASDPAGPWSDPIRVQDGEGFTWFDPSLLFDEDGKVYYTRREVCSIAQAEIDVTTGELKEPLQIIQKPFTSDDIEGPHLYHIGDWYYLLCAEGGTAWGHALSIGRSSNPWGPFEPCPHNPILTHRHWVNHHVRYTGHGDLIQIQDGSWWLVFLATRHAYSHGSPFHHMGRETFLAPVEWADGWPVVNGGERIEYEMDGPSLQRHPWPTPPERDEFNAPQLGPRWTYRREPMPNHVQLLSKGGLSLTGLSAGLNDNAPIAWIGQRLDQPDFTITTQMDFTPKQDGDEAGLTLYLSEEFHAEICIVRQNGTQRIVARQRAATLHAELATHETAHSTITLQAKGNWEQIHFFAGPAPDNLKKIAEVDRRLLCSEVATGWTGCFAALYATGNGHSAAADATFRFFEHRRTPIRQTT